MSLVVNSLPAVLAGYLLIQSTQGYLQARRLAHLAPFWYRGLFLSGAVLIYWYSPLLQQWGAPNAVIIITHGIQDGLLMLMNYNSIVGWLMLDTHLSPEAVHHHILLVQRGIVVLFAGMACLLACAILHGDTEDGFHISYHPTHNLFLNGYRCLAFLCTIVAMTYATRYTRHMLRVTVHPLTQLSMVILFLSRVLAYGVVVIGVLSLFVPAGSLGADLAIIGSRSSLLLMIGCWLVQPKPVSPPHQALGTARGPTRGVPGALWTIGIVMGVVDSTRRTQCGLDNVFRSLASGNLVPSLATDRIASARARDPGCASPVGHPAPPQPATSDLSGSATADATADSDDRDRPARNNPGGCSTPPARRTGGRASPDAGGTP
jgi:hypothetical protein